MSRFIMTAPVLACLLSTLGCGSGMEFPGTAQAPAIVTDPGILTIPTGDTSSFKVALSGDPGKDIVLEVSCIAGGCGFAVQDNPTLYFDRSSFATPQTVWLLDTGRKGVGQSVFRIIGGDLDPVEVLVIRD